MSSGAQTMPAADLSAQTLRDALARQYPVDEWGVFVSPHVGYWSNLSQAENDALIGRLASMSTRNAIRASHPHLEESFYSPKRAGGLELLALQGHETVIDFGCGWGALTIPLAKLAGQVIAIDQTLPSLRFLSARAREEELTNIVALCHDMRKLPDLAVQVDAAVVNGVLEWIPEEKPVELESYFGKRQTRDAGVRPGELQREFLSRVSRALKPGGRLYLAIENRYDFKMFFGGRDPHSGIPLTTLLPRRAADWLSHRILGRPYVTWIYSFAALKRLLTKTGFGRVDLFMCFPDYRYPERIAPYDRRLDGYEPTIGRFNAAGQPSLKRKVARGVESVLFGVLQAHALSPSIIAVAYR
jgi:SAM-dependent methyltransferase